MIFRRAPDALEGRQWFQRGTIDLSWGDCGSSKRCGCSRGATVVSLRWGDYSFNSSGRRWLLIGSIESSILGTMNILVSGGAPLNVRGVKSSLGVTCPWRTLGVPGHPQRDIKFHPCLVTST